ncbi:MAG: hypothetical protein ACRDIL_12880, partial [Candidatus Limnocylindrales bacterium]
AAGAGLAVGNARADLERDLDAGTDSIAIRLGASRAWAVEAVLLAAVIAVALGSLWVRTGSTTASAGVAGAALVIGAGLAWGRGGAPARRERGWEVEAIGVALLAATWLAGYGGIG